MNEEGQKSEELISEEACKMMSGTMELEIMLRLYYFLSSVCFQRWHGINRIPLQ